jgi:hypothetical protein
MTIYVRRSDATDEEIKAFNSAARRKEPFEIDERTYAEHHAEEGDPAVSYPHPIVMMDGTQRMCDFVNIVGDSLAYPYLGFWREGDRYFCQQIVDRLEETADGMDNYLPPPPGWTP